MAIVDYDTHWLSSGMGQLPSTRKGRVALTVQILSDRVVVIPFSFYNVLYFCASLPLRIVQQLKHCTVITQFSS